MALSIGHGYDVHAFCEGRPLVLGGVVVPCDLDCDCTVAAQAPRLAPHRDAMRSAMARAMGCDVSHVGLKATTTERLGFVGREEGIEAWAVCLMERP